MGWGGSERGAGAAARGGSGAWAVTTATGRGCDAGIVAWAAGAGDRARLDRNRLLVETDWTQAADVPQALKDKWAPYRQALRDVPQQAGFPNNIQWPVKPE